MPIYRFLFFKSIQFYLQFLLLQNGYQLLDFLQKHDAKRRKNIFSDRKCVLCMFRGSEWKAFLWCNLTSMPECQNSWMSLTHTHTTMRPMNLCAVTSMVPMSVAVFSEFVSHGSEVIWMLFKRKAEKCKMQWFGRQFYLWILNFKIFCSSHIYIIYLSLIYLLSTSMRGNFVLDIFID